MLFLKKEKQKKIKKGRGDIEFIKKAGKAELKLENE